MTGAPVSPSAVEPTAGQLHQRDLHYEATVFGPLLSAGDVEAALADSLRKWTHTYLTEVERQHDISRGALPRPRSWVTGSDLTRMPEDQLPSVLIADRGLRGVPEAHGDGRYHATWRIEVGVMIVARGNRYALDLARLYAAALRGIVLQQQAMDPLAPLPIIQRVDWVAEAYEELESDSDRTACVASSTFDVQVADVVHRHTGPLEPLPDPDPEAPEWPMVTETFIHLSKLPFIEEE